MKQEVKYSNRTVTTLNTTLNPLQVTWHENLTNDLKCTWSFDIYNSV